MGSSGEAAEVALGFLLFGVLRYVKEMDATFVLDASPSRNINARIWVVRGITLISSNNSCFPTWNFGCWNSQAYQSRPNSENCAKTLDA